MPTPNTSANAYHYDPLLSNVAVAYMQSAADFVHAQVFPVVPSNDKSAKFKKYEKGAFFRNDVQRRPIGGRAPVTTFGATEDTFSCEEFALAAMLDDQERANATLPVDPEATKVELLVRQHMVNREMEWASTYFKTGVWGQDVTGVASGPSATQVVYWNLTTSTPIPDVRKWKRAVHKATGFQPNVLVLGSDVELALMDNPTIIDRFKDTTTGLLDTEKLSAAFGLKVLTALGIKNTADEGQTDALSYIATPKSALLAYAAPAPSTDQPSAGYTFAWTGLLGGGAFATTSPVERKRDDFAHSDHFEVRQAFDMKLVAADLGVFFSAVVQ